MEKTIFKTIHTPLPQLKKIRKRILSENTNSIMILESKLMHIAFKDLCSKLPSRPANLIILGHTKNNTIILDFIRSSRDLRRDFKSSKSEATRWSWCLEQLIENGYTSLSFELAHEK